MTPAPSGACGQGRTTFGQQTTYSTDGGGDTGCADADDVTGDLVLSQSETTYDAGGRAILSVSRERMHDATGTGALGSVTSGGVNAGRDVALPRS